MPIPLLLDVDANVPVVFDVEGKISVQTGEGPRGCAGPCTLQLPPGYLHVTAADTSHELFIEGPSRVTLRGGSAGLKTLGTWLTLGGAAITLAAVLVPLLVCTSRDTTVDAFGRPQRLPSPCSDLSDGVKIGWIAGGGVGVTALLVGVVLLATGGKKLRVEGLSPSERGPTVRLVPWFSPVSPSREAAIRGILNSTSERGVLSSNDRGHAGGLNLVVSF